MAAGDTGDNQAQRSGMRVLGVLVVLSPSKGPQHLSLRSHPGKCLRDTRERCDKGCLFLGRRASLYPAVLSRSLRDPKRPMVYRANWGAGRQTLAGHHKQW